MKGFPNLFSKEAAAVRQVGAVLLAWAMFTAPAMAQGDLPADVSAEKFDQLQATLESSDEVTEERRAELLEQLNAGRAFLSAESEEQTIAEQFRQLADRSEQKIAEFRDRPMTPSESTTPTGDATQTASEIVSKIALLRSERNTLVDRDRQLQRQLEQKAARLREIQERLQLISGRLEANQATLATPADNVERKVARLVALAENRALLAERQRLETEALTEPARTSIAAAERAWISGALIESERRLEALEEAADLARASVAQQKIDDAAALQSALYSENPALLELAYSNRALAERLQEVNRTQEETRLSSVELRTQLDSVKQEFALMQRRLEAAGRKAVLARVMVELLYGLPDIRTLQSGYDQRSDGIATSSLEAIDIEESLRELGRRDAFLARWLPDKQALDEGTLESADELLRQRRQVLQETISSLASLQSLLIESNQVSTALILETKAFQQFLSGNLLWVRSYSTVEAGVLYDQLASLLAVDLWLQFPQLVWDGWRRDQWSLTLLILLPIVFLLAGRVRKPYMAMMSQPTPLGAESLVNILIGLGMSLLLVLPWPLLIYVVARGLSLSSLENPLTQAVAPAIMATALVLYWLRLGRSLIATRGVCRRFLKNNARMLEALRREARWSTPILLACYFLSNYANFLDVTSSGGPLGALCMSVAGAVIISVSIRLLRHPAFEEASRPRLGLKLSAAGGLAVLLLQALGLFFAAAELLEAFALTIVLVVLVKFLTDILKRWLLILRVRLERRAREQAQQLASASEDNQAEIAEQAQDEVDVVELSAAHDKLLGLVQTLTVVGCLVFIWAPLLPALGLLESISLWTTTAGADPAIGFRPVTLFDVGTTALVLVVMVLVAKYLPSMVQVLMLEWLNASAGARYATGMLMQYLVIAVGLSIGLSQLGWEWSKVQWLVAALGVGIGFGLQEIVANFISGLIVLFERPIRVGDIITVGGAEGSVGRISARATLIQTFDRKEVLIPNKQLITEQVTNWSLTDSAVRILIPIGVAYGSDVRRARQLLIEAARDNELVLDDPEPVASFDDFGNDALLLTLRCFASENRLLAWTMLRESINDRFEEAGIVIAFPQRDVHLDMGQPLRIEWDKVPPLHPGEDTET